MAGQNSVNDIWNVSGSIDVTSQRESQNCRKVPEVGPSLKALAYPTSGHTGVAA